VNEGSTIGGVNGNEFYNWEMRPSFLIDTDIVRQPSSLTRDGFSGGANGIPSTAADSTELDNFVIGNPALSTGVYAFQNPEAYDIDLLSIPGFSSGAVIGAGLQFCEGRGDVMMVVDSPFGLRPQQVVDWHNGMLLSDLASAINSSYGALYWGWLKVADQFAGGTIWIPPSGYICGVISRTARDREQWIAPAGINRGRLLSALDVEYNPTMGERDLLYGSGNAINPIVSFTQDGIVVWGQRTLQRASSSLDRVNVRMLLTYLKKNLSVLLRSYLFEPNDENTRQQVVGSTKPFLADISARQGIDAFKVICDESNNTPARIDRNELWVNILIRPVKAAEFIVLNIGVLRGSGEITSEEVLTANGIIS